MGTRAAFQTLATNNGLEPGVIYAFTDDSGRIAVARTTSTYATFAIEGEGSGGGGGSGVGVAFAPVYGTGTGASQNITLPIANLDEDDVFVAVEGLIQQTTDYIITGTTLTITADLGTTIEIRPATSVNAASLNITDVLNAMPQMGIPKLTFYTAGSGTFTTPQACLYLDVEGKGGGGGGSGSGGFASGSASTPVAGNGGNGGQTTFGELVANGGTGGGYIQGGSGGTATGGDLNLSGQAGTAGRDYYTNAMGGRGGGDGGGGTRPDSPGGDAKPNSGSGGAGAGSTGQRDPGSGGGEGGQFRKIIGAPATSYSYGVGAAGTAGTAGVNGFAGGVGAAGYLKITAYFQ